ncbi:MAG: hypothetical protein M9894_18760 [Planctomycetes bacterium]|nr:hypothetical protein [Planctomycetota bacterium]
MAARPAPPVPAPTEGAPAGAAAPAAARARARPTAAPPDPAWLAPLLGPGDVESLEAAYDALADGPPPPEVQARATKALARHDARWREPRDPLDRRSPDSYERLAWIYAAWRRIDPTHRPPPERLAPLLDNAALVARGLGGDRRAGGRLAEALIEVAPDHLGGYLALALVGDDGEVDPGRLEEGAALARGQGDLHAVGLLLRARGLALAERARAGDAEAVAPLRALAREVEGDPDLPWPAVTTVLTHAGEFAGPDEANRWFDRALLLEPDHPRARFGRGRLRLEAGDLAGAEVDGEAALALAERDPADAREVAQAAALLSGALVRSGRPAAALAALERGLALPGAPRAGLALRRVALLASTGAPASDLRGALADLARRLEAHTPAVPDREDRARRIEDLRALAAGARALADGPAPDGAAVQRLIAPWYVSDRLVALDLGW